MPTVTERQASKYVKAIESNSKGALKAVTTSKDPDQKLRERLEAVDDALRKFKQAARVAIREKKAAQKGGDAKPKKKPASATKRRTSTVRKAPKVEAPPQSPRVSNDHFSLFG